MATKILDSKRIEGALQVYIFENIFRVTMEFSSVLLNKIQRKTVDLCARLRGITAELVGFIPQSLVLMAIVSG